MKIFDERIIKLKEFYSIFDGLLSLDKRKWDEVTFGFKNEFENTQKSSYLSFPKSNLKLDNSEHYYLTGMDIPCWVSNEVRTDNRILVLASEPLRSEDSWYENVDKYNEISLNTPFSYHTSKISDDKKERFRYWDLIDFLVKEKKSTVYLTDIRKFWFAGWEHHSVYQKTDIHLDVFDKELELFNPDWIIIFGSKPLDVLQKANRISQKINLTSEKLPADGYILDEKYKVLPLIHPSGAAGGPRKKFFNVNNVKGGNQNEMYKAIIEKIINVW